MMNSAGAIGEDPEEDINVPAVAAYRTSIDTGRPLSERKLAAMFGKTSRRWARSRMAEARQLPLLAIARRVPRMRVDGGSGGAVLRNMVARAAEHVRDEAGFFARLGEAGVLVRLRFSEINPGQVTGYAVGLPSHNGSDGEPFWYGGGRLSAALTLPRLRRRWDPVTERRGGTLPGRSGLLFRNATRSTSTRPARLPPRRTISADALTVIRPAPPTPPGRQPTPCTSWPGPWGTRCCAGPLTTMTALPGRGTAGFPLPPARETSCALLPG